MDSPEASLLAAENQYLREQIKILQSEMDARISAADQAANRLRAFLWELIDTLPERIYVKDAARRFLLVNKTMAEAWDLAAEEFIGKTNDDIHINPELAAMLDATDGVVLESLTELVLPDMMMEDHHGQKKWLSRIKRPIRSLDGQSWNVLGITTDITQIKEHEIALLNAQTELQQQYRQLQQAWRQTIDVLSSTTEAKDPYTAGHQRRVAKLSAAIGKELGFDEEMQTILLLAGAIHDIGKINIPGEILSKPGRLNPIERRLIETHSTAGYDILKSLQLPWPLAQIVFQHHERMDGSGYPQRLNGSDILPEARVIMVADVVESMMSHRPYRMALGQTAALGEISAGRGTRDVEQVVEACQILFDEKRFEF